MHHLYIKEMKEPKYYLLSPTAGHNHDKPCQNFNRSYLPSGKPIALKTFKDQQRSLKKLHIDDWKRASPAYKTAFEGELYHLVRDKNATGFRVESNDRQIMKTLKEGKVPIFEKQPPRPELFRIQSNESNFELNRDLANNSSKLAVSVDFGKLTARP